ncbi:MAG: InlB B-repeat-containing protein [Coriobacteriia bacterium]|nr:InlB B-repeat-containing protein [Coriobacteriia bacterium]
MTKKLSTTVVSVLLLVSALFAVVLLAPPANKAFADTKGTAINQDSFINSEYTISVGGDYYLADNVSGHLRVQGTGNKKVNLDLNGYTLTGADNDSAISSSGNLVITGNGGKIVQPTNMSAITTDENATFLKLDGVSLESDNHSCIDGVTAAIEIKGGSLTVKNSEGNDNVSALYLTYSGSKRAYCEVNGTTLTLINGSTIIRTGSLGNDDSAPELGEGTSLSSFPIQKNDDGTYKASATLKSGDSELAFYKSKDGEYQVVKKSDVPEAAKYCLHDTNFKDELGDVYFEDKTQADSLKDVIGGDIEAKHTITFKTSFKSSEPYTTKYAWDNGTVSAPDAPIKEGCTFGTWYQKTDDGYTKFNFDTKITSDITLYAQWNADVADVNGIFQYPTVQEAIDEAEAGDTVNLLKSVEQKAEVGQGKDITLNLGGNTLSTTESLSSDFPGLISVTGDAKLTIKDGTLSAITKSSSRSPACVYLTGESAELKVENVSMSGNYAPIHATAGTLTVDNGSDYKIEASTRVDYAVYLEGTAKATIVEGEFAASGFDYEGLDDASYGCVGLKGNAQLTIKNGTFDDRVAVLGSNTKLTIENGGFGRPDNASAITDGKVFLKAKDDSFYWVTDEANARVENSRYVVTDANVSPKTKVYTYEYSDAQNYYKYSLTGEKLSKDSTLHKMHKVQFQSQGSAVGEPLYLESLVDAYGELPEGAQLDGYTFDGWFAGNSKITADATTNDDQGYEVNVVAQWTKDSADQDADDDSDSDGSDSDDSSTESDSDSDSLPDTGDPAGAIVVVALAGALAGGVRFLRRAS